MGTGRWYFSGLFCIFHLYFFIHATSSFSKDKLEYISIEYLRPVNKEFYFQSCKMHPVFNAAPQKSFADKFAALPLVSGVSAVQSYTLYCCVQSSHRTATTTTTAFTTTTYRQGHFGKLLLIMYLIFLSKKDSYIHISFKARN